jgi:hypothetical protein
VFRPSICRSLQRWSKLSRLAAETEQAGQPRADAYDRLEVGELFQRPQGLAPPAVLSGAPIVRELEAVVAERGQAGDSNLISGP